MTKPTPPPPPSPRTAMTESRRQRARSLMPRGARWFEALEIGASHQRRLLGQLLELPKKARNMWA